MGGVCLPDAAKLSLNTGESGGDVAYLLLPDLTGQAERMDSLSQPGQHRIDRIVGGARRHQGTPIRA
jgi:hypothetical protein